MKEKVMGVYKITNKINGDCYIGQSTNVLARWDSHKGASRLKKANTYKLPLMRAFRKYGINNFEFEVLENVGDSSKLLELEDKYCNEINPKYNTKILKRPLYQIDPDTFSIIAVFKSETKAAYKTKINRASIYNTCINKRNGAGGFHWTYANKYEYWRENIFPKLDNSVYKINMRTLKIVKEYSSIKKAAKGNTNLMTNIRNVCNRESYYTNNYYWCFISDYDNWKPRGRRRSKIVFFINNKKQATFKGIAETNKEVSYSKRMIYRSLNTGYTSKKGYRFQYLEDYEKENGLELTYSYN